MAHNNKINHEHNTSMSIADAAAPMMSTVTDTAMTAAAAVTTTLTRS